MDCVQSSPLCISLVYKYAQAYLKNVWEGQDPPEDKEIASDIMPMELADRAFEAATTDEIQLGFVDWLKPDRDEDATEVSHIVQGTIDDEELDVLLTSLFSELDENEG